MAKGAGRGGGQGGGRRCDSQGNKRRFSGPQGAAARRGPPAIFITCESGRERKCQREAMELINHYYYTSRPSAMTEQHQTQYGDEKILTTDVSTMNYDAQKKEEKPLNLEEELAMLRRGAAAEEVLSYEPNSKKTRTTAGNGIATSEQISSMKSPFLVYETGMRGTLCILCTLPESEMVPYDDILSDIRKTKENGIRNSDATGGVGNSESTENFTTANHDSLRPSESLKEDGSNGTIPPPWDPVETVKFIFRDAKNASKSIDDDTNIDIAKQTGANPPGSRFISRMIPMQATCYASVEEVKAVSISLLKRCLPNIQSILVKDGNDITFKLEMKRRLCTHLTQQQVIDAIAPVVLGGFEEMPGYKFSVNLSNPDFSIRIETCKTLCGISIFPRAGWYKNFNLAELSNPITSIDEVDG